VVELPGFFNQLTRNAFEDPVELTPLFGTVVIINRPLFDVIKGLPRKCIAQENKKELTGQSHMVNM
jgi:hypothetical protein